MRKRAVTRTKNKAKAEWFKINAPLGKQLGYPDCCIKEFCNQPPVILNSRKATKEDKQRYAAGCIDGEFTGFIPCSAHAKMILMNKIQLQSLIKNRDTNFPPFPLV